ncbi:sugar transferase [Collinsella ihumii]|uniref:sugar transferase n=1 Tax=Collinsella ihumii TaxID=1720204 RepID=UPI00338E70DA
MSADLEAGKAAAICSRTEALALDASTDILGTGTTAEDYQTATAGVRLRTKRYAYRFAKRTFDIVFSLIILVGLSWLFLVIAIAIKLDDPEGPVIFVQTRVGKDGREFRMYKFRSMVTDAEARLVQLLERNEKSGPVFKLHDDPRVTRVGRILRRVSLDELPQFVNVLKGDLSVVGPRPALPKEVAEYTARDRQRLLVKQGLTCFWQVQPDRDDIGFDEWVELDLRYIRECSVVTDLKLIGRTVGCVLTAQGR